MRRLSDHTYDEAQEIMLINRFRQEDVDDVFEEMSRMLMRLHVWAVSPKPQFCVPGFLKDPKYIYSQQKKRRKARIVSAVCEGKHGYDSRSVAHEVVQRMKDYGRMRKRSKMEEGARVYQCQVCHKFHIGSTHKSRTDWRNANVAVA